MIIFILGISVVHFTSLLSESDIVPLNIYIFSWMVAILQSHESSHSSWIQCCRLVKLASMIRLVRQLSVIAWEIYLNASRKPCEKQQMFSRVFHFESHSLLKWKACCIAKPRHQKSLRVLPDHTAASSNEDTEMISRIGNHWGICWFDIDATLLWPAPHASATLILLCVCSLGSRISQKIVLMFQWNIVGRYTWLLVTGVWS